MFTTIILSIILAKLGVINTNILEAEVNFQKPKLERNNIVNKRIWMKNKFKENSYEKATLGDFIFRENSLDVDNILQNNFDVFGEDRMQDTPAFSSYVKRAKRSNDVLRKQHTTKSMKNCKHQNCGKQRYSRDNADSVKSKVINKLKPASVFNDYPYEVAILLNNKRDNNHIKHDTLNITTEATDLTNNSLDFSKTDLQEFNNTHGNTSVPKRSMKYDFETEVIKKFEITEDVNKTDERSENNNNVRDVFDRDDEVWHQGAPVNDLYKVVPKEPQKSKPVSERGLIKVISMLTKTFKKIMRQHNEIKTIHSKIRDISDNFNKNAEAIHQKFQEFDLKYVFLMKFNEDLKSFEHKLTVKEEYFKNKEKEMANSLNEFENQQRKFLMQQRQFYNIQKLMLAQNEKINTKQSLIAKTQSEISHRQNNFARILKKAKQLYIDSKHLGNTKLHANKEKEKDDVKQEMDEDLKQEVLTSTSTATPQTESIKINLFSIPVSNKLENNDDLIIKEKDDQPIDDLVYKYYFNNTFIDNLMKNKILSGIVASPDSENNRRNAKTKRDDSTTILLPVNDSNMSIILQGLNRNRRWINHHSRRKYKRKNRGKGEQITIINATDEKLIRNKHNSNSIPIDMGIPTRDKKDPFITMAMNFCKELQANLDQQMMNWCVEKALRRLQYIDFNLFPAVASSVPPPNPISSVPKTGQAGISLKIPYIPPLDHTPNFIKETSGTLKAETLPTTVTIQPTEPTTISSSPSLITTDTVFTIPTYTVQEGTAVFFPDNDVLESNLKQYELKPDTEGNVYYDGSIHASAIADSESEFTDDFLPGIESNSRVEVDPLAFDVQAKRRAYIRQLNERIKKQLG